MNPLHILFLLFLAVPLLEIYLLIKVGSIIGALPTVLLVVFTAVLGVFLLRLQGFATLNRVRVTLAQGGLPAMEMLEGAVLLVAGALLLTPGFFTDVVGFLCLVPAFRRALIKGLLSRALGFPGSQQGPYEGPGRHGSGHHHGPRTIEGEYRREDD